MAKIALRLQPTAPGYVDSVLRLSWGTLLMSLWIEVAVRRQRSQPVDVETCTILEGRRLMPATGSGLPGVAAASAAFDARADGGMFEITIQSTSPVSAVESAFTTAYGRPTEVTGARRFWTLDNIRVSLSPARQSLGERFGFQSTFVARFRPQSDVFYRDRDVLCP